jgi:hypothetical protein
MPIEVEKCWKLKADGVHLSIREMSDEQLRELDRNSQAMNEFPTLLEAVNREIERRENELTIRRNADWVAGHLVSLMQNRLPVTIADVKDALDRLEFKPTTTA